MRKSRIAAIGFSTIMLVGILTGCASTTPEADPSKADTGVPAAAAPATSITITLKGDGVIRNGNYSITGKADAQSDEFEGIEVPWTTTLDVSAGSGTNYATVLATAGTDYKGDLECEIKFDDVVISTMKATGANAFVICSATDF